MIKIWLTENERKLIRIVTRKSEDKVTRLKTYLYSMQHVSVSGEENEMLEDTVQEIMIKIKNLSDTGLKELIADCERI